MHLVKTSQLWSKSALHSEFGLDRRTIAKLLEGIDPADKVRGQPAYRLIDVVPVIGSYMAGTSPTGSVDDPEELGPKDRKDWYDGEAQRLKVAEAKRGLIPDTEFIEVVSTILKSCSTNLLTLGDVLERDANLTPEQTDRVDRIARDLMESMRDEVRSKLPVAE